MDRALAVEAAQDEAVAGSLHELVAPRIRERHQRPLDADAICVVLDLAAAVSEAAPGTNARDGVVLLHDELERLTASVRVLRRMSREVRGDVRTREHAREALAAGSRCCQRDRLCAVDGSRL